MCWMINSFSIHYPGLDIGDCEFGFSDCEKKSVKFSFI